MTRVELLPTSSPDGLGIVESYYVNVTLRGADAEVVGTIHVHEPTGLSSEHATGGGSTTVIALFASEDADGTPRAQMENSGTFDMARGAARAGGRIPFAIQAR